MQLSEWWMNSFEMGYASRSSYAYVGVDIFNSHEPNGEDYHPWCSRTVCNNKHPELEDNMPLKMICDFLTMKGYCTTSRGRESSLRDGRSGDRIPVVGRDFLHPSRPVLGPNQPPIQWVAGLFWGVKRPGRGADHPPLSRAEVEGRVELYIWSTSGPSWLVLRWTFTVQRSSMAYLPKYDEVPDTWTKVTAGKGGDNFTVKHKVNVKEN